MPPETPITRTAYVHVDLDNLWAIAECYGLAIPDAQRDYVYRDALPRFEHVFANAGLNATFFVVGRDLEYPDNVALLKQLQNSGHRFANHSYSHHLGFRDLSTEALQDEVSRCENSMMETLGVKPQGFRAPGYGFSKRLLGFLKERGYKYDSSLMPSPYGFVFRFLDSRLQKRANENAVRSKTQYPLSEDAKHPLLPFDIDGLREYPVAAAPLLRLPFQAGVCMKLGKGYFRALLNSYAAQKEPFIFLLHAADLCDFRKLQIPFFRDSPFFGKAIGKKLAFVEYALAQIQSKREIRVLEEDLRPQT